MPATRTVNGKVYILQPDGRYREASPTEQMGAETSPLQAFGLGVAAWPAQTGRMLETLGNLNVSLQGGTPGPERPLTGPESAAANVGQFSPNAVTAGGVAADLATLPLGWTAAPKAALGATAAGSMASRVSRAIAAAGAPKAPTVTEGVGLLRRGLQLTDEALGVINRPMSRAARQAGYELGRGTRSVGAAQADDVARRVAPGLNRGPLEQLWSELLDPTPMNTQQLESAIWGRQRGFEQLPGMADGLQLLRAGAESDPIISPALRPILQANQAKFEGFLADALGVSRREGFGKATLGEVRDRVLRPVYQQVESVLDEGGGVPLPEQFMADVEMFIPRRMAQLMDMDLGKPQSGQALMNLRSKLWEAADGLSTQGRTVESGAARGLVRQLEAIMEAKIGDPELVRAWQQAGNRYRLLMALEKPGVIAKDGTISVPKLANVLKREYPDEFARMREGPRARLDPAIRETLNDVEFFDTFGSLIGDSGTATRLGMRDLDPRSIAARFWLRDAMTGYVEGLNAPGAAAP